MKCSIETSCDNPHLQTVDTQVFCFNCYGLHHKRIKEDNF